MQMKYIDKRFNNTLVEEVFLITETAKNIIIQII